MLTNFYQKNEVFRMEIRKKQIEQVFQQQRRRFLQQARNKQIYNLTQTFQNQNNKEQFIIQTSKQLEGDPTYEWQNILTNLKASVFFYKYELNKWVDLRIIKNLTLLFKEDLGGLSKLAADILTDIWYISERQQNQGLIKKIMNYDFVEDLINLCTNNCQLPYLRLISSIAHSPERRKHIVSKGILQIVVNLLNNIKAIESQEKYLALGLVKVILTVFKIDKDTIIPPQKQMIKKLLPQLNKHITLDYSNKYYLIILQSIKQLTKMKNEWVYQQLLKSDNIMKKVFQLQSLSADKNVRAQSTYILSYFMLSQNLSHIEKLLELNLLEAISNACLREQNEKNVILLINVIGNLTADQGRYQQLVANHRIFDEVLLQNAQFSYSQKIKESAMYCICNIFHCKNPEVLEKLVFKDNCLELIKRQLRGAKKNTAYFNDLVETMQKLMSNAHEFQNREIGIVLREKDQIQELLIDAEEEIPEVVKIFIDTLQQYE